MEIKTNEFELSQKLLINCNSHLHEKSYWLHQSKFKIGSFIILIHISYQLCLKANEIANFKSHECAGCQNKNLKFTLFAGTARKRLKIWAISVFDGAAIFVSGKI
jgi:hypothetical protein